jgi:hypothetical protein
MTWAKRRDLRHDLRTVRRDVPALIMEIARGGVGREREPAEIDNVEIALPRQTVHVQQTYSAGRTSSVVGSHVDSTTKSVKERRPAYYRLAGVGDARQGSGGGSPQVIRIDAATATYPPERLRIQLAYRALIGKRVGSGHLGGHACGHCNNEHRSVLLSVPTAGAAHHGQCLCVGREDGRAEGAGGALVAGDLRDLPGGAPLNAAPDCWLPTRAQLDPSERGDRR